MTNLNSRLARLEKQASEQPYGRPQNVYIYGTREDDTTYLIETWRQLIEAESIELSNRWEIIRHEQP